MPAGWDLKVWREFGRAIESANPDGSAAVLLLGDGARELMRPAVVPGPYGATPSDHHLFDRRGLPKFGLGRLPIRTNAQGTRYLKSVRKYERRDTAGRPLLIGDAPDGRQDFRVDVADLAEIYEGEEERIVFPSLEKWKEMDGTARWSLKRRLRKDFSDAAMKAPRSVIHFLGHSSMRSFGRPPYLATGLVTAGHFKAAPSIWFVAGCSAAAHDVPAIDALGEHLLLSGRARAVGVVGATSLTDHEGARKLNFLLARETSNGRSVGEALQRARERLSRIERAPYVLLGDPLTRVRLADLERE